MEVEDTPLLSRGHILPRWGNPPSRDRIRDASNSRKIHFGGGFASLPKVTIQHTTQILSIAIEKHLINVTRIVRVVLLKKASCLQLTTKIVGMPNEMYVPNMHDSLPLEKALPL